MRLIRRPDPPARGPHGAPICGYESDQVCPGHTAPTRNLRGCNHLERGIFCPFYPQIKTNRARVGGPPRTIRVVRKGSFIGRLFGVR